MGEGIEFRIEVDRPLQHESLHVGRVRGFDRIHHQYPLDRRVALDGQHLFQLVLCGHRDDARAGVVEDEGSLIRRLRGINRNRDRAHGKRSEIGNGPFRAIFAKDGDAIALANTPGFKPASQANDTAVNFCGRDRDPAQRPPLQHDAVAALLADRQQNVIQSLEAHPFRSRSRKSFYKVIVRSHCTESEEAPPHGVSLSTLAF